MPEPRQDLVERAEAQVTPMPDREPTLLEIVSRAARDPAVDVEKLEKLMAMAERQEARIADRAYSDAMRAAQKEMEPVRANANNSQTKSKYATFDALDTAIRPAYSKHGFSISHDTDDSPKEDHVRVVMFVRHIAGHRERLHIDIPCDGKGAKGNDVMTKTHAVMSAVTYGKRGNLGAAFNIVVVTDDDGNAAGGNGPITPEQLATINGMMEKADADPEKFAKYMGVEALKDIPANKYGRALEALNLAIDKRERDKSKQK